MPDIAGNSLTTATTLNLTSTPQSFADRVTPAANDYYRFILSAPSSLNLSLTGLDANADLELLDSRGDVVNVGGVPQRSANPGTFSDLINTTLNAGLYYIRVAPGAAVSQANYTLSVSAQDNLLSTDLLWRYNLNPALTVYWDLDQFTYVSFGFLTADRPSNWTVGALGDLNGDGNTDIIWRDGTAGLTDVWFMNGATLLSSASIFPTLGSDWVLAGTGDFNKDGQVDLLWRNPAAARTDVWFMNSTTLLSSTTIELGSTGADWVVGAVGDFNKDGNLDILWQNQVNSLTAFWILNSNLQIEAVTFLPTPDPGWKLSGAGDFNRDGSLDLIWQFQGSTGDVAGWFLDRTALTGVFLLPPVNDPGWTVYSPYNTYGTPASIDTAGNSFTTPFDLGTSVSGRATYRDQLNSLTDTQDYYRFNIANPTQLSLALSGLSANLRLFDSNGVQIAESSPTGTNPGSLRSQLNAGTYFIEVSQFAGEGGTYSLGISVNTPPVLVSNNGLSVNEGGTTTLSNAALQVADAENSPAELTYTIGGLPVNGDLIVNGVSATTGTTFTEADVDAGTRIQYIHNGSETTSDRFTFTVSDGAGGSIGVTTFSISVIPVNDPPVLTLPTGTQAVDQQSNTLLSGIGVTDVDLGTGEFTVTLSAGNGVLTLGRTTGITFLNGSGNGNSSLSFRGTQDVTNFVLQSLLYRSNNNFRGADSVSVTVSDGGNTGLGGPLSASGVISLTVAPVNDAPVLTAPTAQTVLEDVSTPILGISVGDLDSGSTLLQVSLIVTNGTLFLNSTSGVNLLTGSGQGDRNLAFTGSLDAINRVLTGLSYLGDRNFNGTDVLRVSVSDQLNGTNGIPLSDTKIIPLTITAVNDAPVLTVPGAQQVDQNTDLRVTGVSVNDVDATDLTVNLFASSGRLSLGSTTGLTFDVGNGTQNSLVSFRGSQAAVNDALRTMIYRANTDFRGNDTITINVSDGGGTGIGGVLGDSKTIAVSVLGINQPPVITVPTASLAVDSDTNLTIAGVQVNDPDANGGTLSVTLFAQNGVLSLANTQGITFTQGNGNQNNRVTFSGTLFAINAALSSIIYRSYPGFTSSFDAITLQVNDNGNTGIGIPLSDTRTLRVNVGGAVNRLPVAVNDIFSVAEDNTLNAGSVLANDSDPDFTLPLTAQIVAAPANALSFTLNPNGTFSYTPRLNYNGVDTFTYRAIDNLGGISNTATVTISVTPVNDAPIAANDGPFSVSAGGTLTVTGAGVLSNDTDIDTPLANLTAQLVTGPTNGVLSLNPNGSFTYRPTGNFSGIDRFTYVANDGSLTSNLATVTISVGANSAPIANPDSFTLGQNGTLTAGNVLTNDTDPDGNLPLTATLAVAPPSALSFTLNPDGTFRYQPRSTFVGTDTFVYRAVDRLGAISPNATVTFNVTAVNQAPNVVNDNYSIANTTSLAITAPGVLANDTDPEGLSLTASLVATTPNGTLTLNPNGSFTYRPNTGFVGVDSFTYRANDGSLNSQSVGTANITVSGATNQPPIANPDLFVTRQNTSITTGNVLANDTDPERTALTASVIAAPTNALSFTLNPDGTFSYLPNLDFLGADTFTYVAVDASGLRSQTATATFSVTNANLPPAANGDLFRVPFNTSLTTGNVLTNDTDPENSPLTASVVAAPTSALSFTLNPDGSFNYLPTLNFTGADTFTYVAVDAFGLTSNLATVTFSVNPANRPPLVSNDSVAVNAGSVLTVTAPGVLSNDTDPDGNSLTASILTNTTRGTVSLNSDGSFVYTPNSGFLGTDSFTYLANDGTLNSNTATVTIRVNAPPVASNDTYTAVIGGAINIASLQGVLANDTDPDSSLTASVVTGPAQGTLTLNPNGSFVYTANSTATGVDSFIYRATDGLASSTATVTLSLRTNVPPVAVGETYRVGTNGTLNVATIDNVLRNDTDADPGTTLTATLVTNPTRGSLSLNPTGTFTYIPQTGFSGVDSFVYRASDGIALSNPATVTISVSPNQPPVANNDTYTAFSGIPRNQPPPGVKANDTDPNGDNLSIFLVSGPAQGSLTLNPDGSFIYTANATFQGVDTFTYRAFDGIASSTATVTMSVVQNLPPVARGDQYGAIAGETLLITAPGVLSNDTDPEGTLFALGGGTPPRNGLLLSFNSDGSFSYVPNPGFTGTDSFTYVASDGVSQSFGTVTISVVGANSPPIANPDNYRVNLNNVLIVPRTLGVLANDTDPNTGQQLSASVVTNPAQGTLSLNPDGSFVYTPNTTASGTDSFTYAASDGSLSSTAGVTITISATSTPPVVQNDNYTVATNGTLSITAAGVLANDSDPNGDIIRSTVATTPSNGTLTLNPDGSFVYRPIAGFQGTDSFTYLANDGLANSSPATVFITVGGANAAPVVSTPGTQLISQNSTLTIASGLSVNDPDAGTSPIQITLTATNGTITLSGIAGLNFSTGDGTADPAMVFTGTIANVNAALANLQFTPTTGFAGATSVTLTANDQGATGTGGPQTGRGTVTINVTSGATLVTNISPGASSSTPTNLVSVGNTVYFAASDGTNGAELWKSDGTAANTTLVADIDPGSSASTPTSLTVVGNFLYYTANSSATGVELWRTDLTTGTGATLVRDIRPGIDSSNPQNLVNYANNLFFVATDGAGVRQLWKVDPTGTASKVFSQSNVGNLTVVNNTLFFTTSNGSQLWKVDSPTSAPVSVRSSGFSSISNLTAVGNRLFFTANDPTAGTELWSSDGTLANTNRVTDLNPGTAGSSPNNLVAFNGNLYFFAQDSTGGAFKLFQSTPAGVVSAIATLPSGNPPTQLTVVGNRLFFAVDNGTAASPSQQLWSSDGAANTSLVRDVNATGNDQISSLTNFNGTLLFVANDGTGFRIFRTDGSAANTVPISGTFTAPPTSLTAAGTKLLFAASDGANGNELWTVG